MREYKHRLPLSYPNVDLIIEVFTVKDWEKIKDTFCKESDGCGYWMKDNLQSCDDVYHTPQLDATHVSWYPN